MTTDKIDNHYFQQLSALMDGDLPPDQARFLLRRMQHDAELTGCWERWQLCGDALRGHAHAPAPTGFAERIATAISAEPMQLAANASTGRVRGNLAKWGGGALAASVAAVALFMGRQLLPEEKSAPATPVVASQASANEAAPTATDNPVLETAATATAASVAAASVPLRQDRAARRSATRTQQAVRSVAPARRLPADRAVASASVPVVPAIASTAVGNVPRDPFSNVQINAPAARPWPRAVLPQYSAGSGSFNADYASDRAAQAFYPFEPRLLESPPVALPEPAPQDR